MVAKPDIAHLDSGHAEVQRCGVTNQVEMLNRMTPPGCNEVSPTWQRHLITKSKTTLDISSAESSELRN